MKKLFLLFCISSSLVHAELVDRTVAIVGKELILMSDAVDSLQQRPPVVRTLDEAIKLLIDKAILVSECKKFSFYPAETEVIQQINDIKKQNKLDDNAFRMALLNMGTSYSAYETQLYFEMCKTKLIQNKIRNRVNITSDDIQRAHNEAASETTAKQLALRSLLFKPLKKTPANRELAKQSSLLVLKKLVAGEPFDSVDHSDDARVTITRQEFGLVSREDLLPSIANVVFSPSSERFLGPLEIDSGFYIFEILERPKEQKKPLVDEEKDLHKQLFEKEIERLLKQYIEEARSSTYVSIMESAS